MRYLIIYLRYIIEIILHGTKTWAITRALENKLDVREMRRLSKNKKCQSGLEKTQATKITYERE